MQRFRIKQTDTVTAYICHKGQVIASLYDSGFNTIDSVKYQILNKLGWSYKGYGRRVEITIHNQDTGQTKYLNTFS